MNTLDEIPDSHKSKRPDLIIKVDGKIVVETSIMGHIDHMNYNDWKRCPLATIGNMEVYLIDK